MDYFERQERERVLRNQSLPLHNRRYVIIYERENHKVEVVSVDSEQLSHAIFSAILVQVQEQLDICLDYGRTPFDFSLHMWRCPNPGTVSTENPNRWNILMGKAVGHKDIVPIQVQAASGQFPLRGYDLEQFLGID